MADSELAELAVTVRRLRLSRGRTGAAGMIFFNERGDEVGGLTFHGDSSSDGYSAGGHLAAGSSLWLDQRPLIANAARTA